MLMSNKLSPISSRTLLHVLTEKGRVQNEWKGCGLINLRVNTGLLLRAFGYEIHVVITFWCVRDTRTFNVLNKACV